MPTPIDRKSLATNLEQRYGTQRVGGANDAKRAGTCTIPISINAKLYENTQEFVINEKQGISNLKGIVDGGTYKELSKFGQGISTKKYKA